jgi:hypothetical protein
VGKLFEAVQKIDAAITQKNLDRADMRGKIGLKAGVLLAVLKADTPDDPAKLEKLRRAAQDVLGIQV